MNEDGGPDDALYERWYRSEEDQILARLLPAAVTALHDEDRRLSAAFAAAPNNPRLAPRNQGLGYWLFETTLVYTIFKSWLPLAETDWEAPYPVGAKKADLLVLVDGAPRYVFEAKWWMTTIMDDELRGDIEKMKRWSGLMGRFLLTFWRSPKTPAIWQSDIDGVRRFCKDCDGTLVYVGAFPTDEAATRATTGSYFAVGVIAV